MQIGKKLVSSDYKNGRVKDPTSISEKQEKQVRKYCKEFFEKAVEKDKERQRKRAERKAKDGAKSPDPGPDDGAKGDDAGSENEMEIAVSDERRREAEAGVHDTSHTFGPTVS